VDASGNVHMIASRVVMKRRASSTLAVNPSGNSVFVTHHVGSRATAGLLPWEKDDAQGFVPKLPAG